VTDYRGVKINLKLVHALSLACLNIIQYTPIDFMVSEEIIIVY